MQNILIDTCIWYSLCDKGDSSLSRDDFITLMGLAERHRVILPWPIGYETLRTSFVKNRSAMQRFEELCNSPNTTKLDDTLYRDDALVATFRFARLGRPLSMADCLLRFILEDINVRVDALFTINKKDFYDVCSQRNIPILPDN